MDNREQLLEGIAMACNVQKDELTEDLDFNKDLGAKSGTYFAIIAVIEQISGKKVKYADVRKRKTVGAMLEYLDELTA